MAVAANSWITLAQFKTWAGITSTDATRDAIIEAAIDNASVELCGMLGREIAKTTYTNEYIDGNGMPDLLLENYPVVSISALTEDDVSLTEGLTADYLLYAKQGRLQRISNGIWLEAPKAIKITYVAGYVVQGGTVSTGETAIPFDLRKACCIQTAIEWKHSQRADWGLSTVSAGEGSLNQFSDSNAIAEVKALLNRYRVGAA